MRNPTVFFGAIVIAVIAALVAIYYAIPGVNHVLISGDVPAVDPQPKHIILFAAIAAVCVVAALVTRPRANVR